MAFSLDSITKKISSASQSVVQKGKNVADVTKLNSQINEANKVITENYIALGKAYYEQNKENPNAADLEIFSVIAENEAKIEELKAQVRAIKGISLCPNCGAEVASSNKFCPNCGTAMPVPEPAPEPAPAGKVCPNCGESVGENEKFCAKCGSPLE